MSPQLTTANVDALRCNFVSAIADYIDCTKHSISCDLTTSKDKYQKYKLAVSGCSLDDATSCNLLTSYTDDKVGACQVNIACADQAIIKLKNTGSPTQYTASIINDSFGDSAPVFSARGEIELVNNSIYHNANLTVGIIDQDFSILDSTVFSTGKAKVGASVVTNDVYKLKAATFFALDNAPSLPSGFLKTIRIYYTNNIGQFVPTNYWDIDVSTTSNYLACGTCTPVVASDLLFSSPNWSTAIKTVVDNAIRDLTGSVNIDFTASKQTNRALFFTTVKHKPSSTWCALRPKDFKFVYSDGASVNTTAAVSALGPAYFPTGGGNLYGTHSFTIPCGTKVVEVPNAPMNFDGAIDQTASEFNEFKLVTNKTFLSGTISDQTTTTCNIRTYTVTVTSAHTVTNVQWLNSALTVVGTGYTFSTQTTGNYTCRVTLSSGCVLDTPFTIT